MKKSLKVSALALTAIATFSLASCGKKVSDDANTLEIYTYLGGYGDEFIRKSAEEFQKLHPEVTIEISGDSTPDKVNTKLTSGPKNNTTDLMFAGESFFKVLDQGPNALKGYDCVLEPLDDVYNHKINGVTIEEMFNESYLKESQFKVNGEKHYYTFSWADSLTGLVYNHTKFEKENLEVPLTTDMMLEMADKVKTDENRPFISSTSVGYYEYLREILHIQYEGIDNYENFYRGVDNGRYSKDIFKQKGRLYSLEVIEQIVSDKYKRSNDRINTLTYPQAQTKFLTGEGYIMPNGDWLENELKSINENNKDPQDFRMMKTPILSKIIEKTPSIKDDATLREVIKYVDKTITEKPSGVTDEDIEYINQARHYIYSLGLNHNAVIPVYATAKELAKEFLKFLCTPEGIKIYQQETSGNSLPLKAKYTINEEIYNNLSNFQKSKYDIISNGKFGRRSFPLVYKGGLGPYVGERKSPEVVLGVKGNTAMTAKQIYDAEINYYTDSVWNAMLTKAGIK